jgi:thiamine-monophosphate kinase
VDEFELIRRFFVREDEAASVITGIGDDGAVIRPPTGKDIVTVVDTLVEGVHFPRDVLAPDANFIGHRAVAANLSDIAAMGAEPRWMTLALTLREVDKTWLTRFSAGLHELAASHGVVLVGGDTTRGDATVVTVQITGIVDPGRMICRSGAKPGETIYVSGDIGDAAAGLYLMQNPPEQFLGPHDYLQGRFMFPTPRVALGRSLANKASAAIDISDGLYGDLEKLLVASATGAELNLDSVPMSLSLRSSFDKEQQRQFALCGGEDFELCFTSPESLPSEIEGVQITPIGKVTNKSGIVCREKGDVVPFKDSGYRHFQ